MYMCVHVCMHVFKHACHYKILNCIFIYILFLVFIKKMNESSTSVVFLEGEKLDSSNGKQGMALSCSLPPLPPVLFSVFINDLLNNVKRLNLGYN